METTCFDLWHQQTNSGLIAFIFFVALFQVQNQKLVVQIGRFVLV